MTRELVDLECSGQSTIIVDFALIEIDSDLIVGMLCRPPCDLGDFVFAQDNGQHAVLHAIVGEDISERWCDEDTETEIFQRPDGMFSRRSATEILPHDQNTCAHIAGMVQNE